MLCGKRGLKLQMKLLLVSGPEDKDITPDNLGKISIITRTLKGEDGERIKTREMVSGENLTSHC